MGHQTYDTLERKIRSLSWMSKKFECKKTLFSFRWDRVEFKDSILTSTFSYISLRPQPFCLQCISWDPAWPCTPPWRPSRSCSSWDRRRNGCTDIRTSACSPGSVPSLSDKLPNWASRPWWRCLGLGGWRRFQFSLVWPCRRRSSAACRSCAGGNDDQVWYR